MHRLRIVAFHEQWRVTVTREQRLQLGVADARQDRRVGNLVAIQVQDWQHCPIAHGVEELVRMPRGRQRPRLGLAVTDDAGDDEIGIVERHAVRVRQAVAELPSFVDRARGLGRDMTADVTRKRKLLEESPHPFCVLALVRIDLGVGPFEIGRREHAGGAVTRSGDEDHVEVVFDDQPVEMRPHKRQRRARAPVAEQPVLHVIGPQRLLEQRVVLQIDHPDREVIAGPPEGVNQFHVADRQWTLDPGFHVRMFVRSKSRHGIPPDWLRSSGG